MKCPNCGGIVQYDPERKQMICQKCGSSWEAEDLPWGEGTEWKETGEYEAKIFTCPECGGVTLRTDDESVDFCSFCGASVQMTMRKSREHAPKYIIPFSVDKERSIDCLKQFASYTKFVPKEYTDDTSLSRVQPFYIPYWSYDVVQQGHVSADGISIDEKRNQREACHLYWVLDTEYPSVLFDASEVFDDEISMLLSPFNRWMRKEFHPAYLNGCRVATATVESDVYLESAQAAANEQTYQALSVSYSGDKKLVWPRPDEKSLNDLFETKLKRTEAAMMPVWILTWRNKNRVAYTAVNGESGKAAGDLPIDYNRFYLFVASAAAILFLLFNFLLPYIRTDLLLAGTAALVFVSLDIASRGLTYLYRREHHLNDKGVLSHRAGTPPPRALSPVPKMTIPPSLVPIAVVFLSYLFRFALKDFDQVLKMFELYYRFAIVGFMAGTLIKIGKRWFVMLKALQDSHLTALAIMTALALTASFAVILIVPLSDYIFYGVMILLAGLDMALLAVLAGKLNRITTRPVPLDLQEDGTL